MITLKSIRTISRYASATKKGGSLCRLLDILQLLEQYILHEQQVLKSYARHTSYGYRSYYYYPGSVEALTKRNISLAAASIVIHFDPWWNMAVICIRKKERWARITANDSREYAEKYLLYSLGPLLFSSASNTLSKSGSRSFPSSLSSASLLYPFTICSASRGLTGFGSFPAHRIKLSL